MDCSQIYLKNSMNIEEKISNTRLFLVYQSLLTDKQRKYMNMYVLEDYSFGEIAISENVSRNAVFDQIKRTIILLKEFESKLQLIKKENLREQLIEDLEKEFSISKLLELKNIK